LQIAVLYLKQCAVTTLWLEV